MEKQQVTVTILGQEYKIMASSPEEKGRIQKTATFVQGELEEILSKTGASQVTALVYAALNMGDRFCKEQEGMENLRVQITESAERVAKLEKELQKLKQDKPKRETTRRAKAQEPPPQPEPMIETTIQEQIAPLTKETPVVAEPVVKENPVVAEPVVKENPVVAEPVVKENPVVAEPVAKENPEPKESPEVPSQETKEPDLESVTLESSTPESANQNKEPMDALAELAQEVERAVDQTKLPDC